MDTFVVRPFLPRLILFEPRLCKQQPMRRIFNRTSMVPDAIPISSKSPEALPIDGDEVVGGPPSDEAGCDGGGVSAWICVHKMEILVYCIHTHTYICVYSENLKPC